MARREKMLGGVLLGALSGLVCAMACSSDASRESPKPAPAPPRVTAKVNPVLSGAQPLKPSSEPVRGVIVAEGVINCFRLDCASHHRTSTQRASRCIAKRRPSWTATAR